MNWPRDPGLQPERTVMAWNRTAATMAANAVVLLRLGLEPDARFLLLPGGLLSAFAVMLFATGRSRRNQLLTVTAAAPSVRLLAAICACVLVAACAALWATIR